MADRKLDAQCIGRILDERRRAMTPWLPAQFLAAPRGYTLELCEPPLCKNCQQPQFHHRNDQGALFCDTRYVTRSRASILRALNLEAPAWKG